MQSENRSTIKKCTLQHFKILALQLLKYCQSQSVPLDHINFMPLQNLIEVFVKPDWQHNPLLKFSGSPPGRTKLTVSPSNHRQMKLNKRRRGGKCLCHYITPAILFWCLNPTVNFKPRHLWKSDFQVKYKHEMVKNRAQEAERHVQACEYFWKWLRNSFTAMKVHHAR